MVGSSEASKSSQSDELSIDRLDLLIGAREIATFMFGEYNLRTKLKVYRLTTVHNPSERIPHFKVGSSILARRSKLITWVKEREAATAQAA